MRITVCDDIFEEAKEIAELTEQYLTLRQISAELSVVTQPEKVRQTACDILILDVEMPEIDGITLKNQLAVEADCPLIIFATNYADAISRAFNKNVIGFLMKPVNFEQLTEYLDLAMVHLNLDRNLILENGSTVSTGEIAWIEAEKGYTVLHLSGGRVCDGGRKTIEYWERELEDNGFLRIDKGHIVSSRFVRSFRDDRIVLSEEDRAGNPVRFTVSRRKKKDCYQQYLRYCSRIAKYI